MCKVLIVAGIKPETSEKTWKFIKAMAKPMSKHNTDGLGYSAITAEGKMFGERWLTNSEAFIEDASPTEELDQAMFGELAGAVDGRLPDKKVNGEYNTFGEVMRDQAVAVTMHTRMATTPKGMNNTHPFVDEGISLIHNGIIRNADEIGLKISTCDSEAILRQYIDEKVKDDPANFQTVAERLQGYYACGVLTNTDQGPILDIFKGNSASLYVTFVKELETYVLCTSDDDIKSVCKDLGYSTGEFWKILEGRFIRVNAITHKTISITNFTVGSSYKVTSYPQHQSVSNQHTGTRTTGAGHSTTKSLPANASNVMPFGPMKENTPIPTSFMHYFKQGKASIIRLTEHEQQEEIMKNERFYGMQ